MTYAMTEVSLAPGVNTHKAAWPAVRVGRVDRGEDYFGSGRARETGAAALSAESPSTPMMVAPCAIQASGCSVQKASALMLSARRTYSMGVRDGITTASPVRTSSARWFVHTVRRRMRFFSRLISTTSTRAEIESPDFTGLRNLSSCET